MNLFYVSKSHSVMSDSATPWTAAHQASCPSPIPGACSNSSPLSQWCHPTISSTVTPSSLPIPYIIYSLLPDTFHQIFLDKHNDIFFNKTFKSSFYFLWCWERLRAKREHGGNRGWDGWMASLTQWTWVWTNSGRAWGTRVPSVLQSMGSQSRIRLSDWTTILCNKHEPRKFSMWNQNWVM